MYIYNYHVSELKPGCVFTVYALVNGLDVTGKSSTLLYNWDMCYRSRVECVGWCLEEGGGVTLITSGYHLQMQLGVKRREHLLQYTTRATLCNAV